MNAWVDLLRDALDALGEGAYHARAPAKEEISNSPCVPCGTPGSGENGLVAR
jgi:hypothetical protein